MGGQILAARLKLSSAAGEGIGRSLGTVAALFILMAAMTVSSPHFLTTENLISVLKQAAPIGIMAAGQTILMISGGFDISVGAVYSMCGAITAVLWIHGFPQLAFPFGILAGAGIGLINGLVVTVLRVNPFIATLGMTLVIRSLTIPLTNSSIIFVPGDAFKLLGNASVIGLPLQLWIFALVLVFGEILLRRTNFGRYVYASGGNPEAARLSGVPVRAIRLSAFTISGASAAVAGLIAVSQLGIAGSQPGVGSGLEFSVIAAVVVGGTSLFGGRGAMWRTLAGVSLLAFLQNGFNLLNLDYSTQQAITGAAILIAVAFDALTAPERRGA